MSASPHEIEASDAMLAEAAKSDLVVMRHVQSLVLEATDPQAVGTLVHAYARVSRAMRQNLGLLARQKADRAKAEREAARREADLEVRREGAANRKAKTLEELAYEERADALHDAVGRVISAAADGDTRLHTDWAHRFDRELDDWYETEDFLDEELPAQVRRACRTLGLPDDLAARWRSLPDPTFFPDPAEADDEEDEDDEPDTLEAARSDSDDATADPAADPDAPPVPWRNSG